MTSNENRVRDVTQVRVKKPSSEEQSISNFSVHMKHPRIFKYRFRFSRSEVGLEILHFSLAPRKH